jgi:hypothetical protein
MIQYQNPDRYQEAKVLVVPASGDGEVARGSALVMGGVPTEFRSKFKQKCQKAKNGLKIGALETHYADSTTHPKCPYQMVVFMVIKPTAADTTKWTDAELAIENLATYLAKTKRPSILVSAIGNGEQATEDRLPVSPMAFQRMFADAFEDQIAAGKTLILPEPLRPTEERRKQEKQQTADFELMSGLVKRGKMPVKEAYSHIRQARAAFKKLDRLEESAEINAQIRQSPTSGKEAPFRRRYKIEEAIERTDADYDALLMPLDRVFPKGYADRLIRTTNPPISFRQKIEFFLPVDIRPFLRNTQSVHSKRPAHSDCYLLASDTLYGLADVAERAASDATEKRAAKHITHSRKTALTEFSPWEKNCPSRDVCEWEYAHLCAQGAVLALVAGATMDDVSVEVCRLLQYAS